METWGAGATHRKAETRQETWLKRLLASVISHDVGAFNHAFQREIDKEAPAYPEANHSTRYERLSMQDQHLRWSQPLLLHHQNPGSNQKSAYPLTFKR